MHKKRSKRGKKKLIDEMIQEEMFEFNEISKKIKKEQNIISGNPTLSLSKPRNERQKKYLQYLNDETVKVITAAGPAGTGKTLFACENAISRFINGEIEKIIITRPVVSADEDIGYLPGDLEDKMDPYMRPLYDIFYNFMHPEQLMRYLKDKSIEIVPLAFMRGRTFKKCWIIADEMQNATCDQTMMLLTRIGTDSKIILTGDPDQHDRKNKVSGLNDFINRSKNYEGKSIKNIYFLNGDIEREPIVKDILNLYDL